MEAACSIPLQALMRWREREAILRGAEDANSAAALCHLSRSTSSFGALVKCILRSLQHFPPLPGLQLPAGSISFL